jgi:hypothetical protein
MSGARDRPRRLPGRGRGRPRPRGVSPGRSIGVRLAAAAVRVRGDARTHRHPVRIARAPDRPRGRRGPGRDRRRLY